MPTIFITGASSGLGHATAKLFAAKGWQVIATMRTPEKTPDLAQLPGVTVLPLDVTDPAQIKTTVAQALALGEVDVVFNNAGYATGGPLEMMTDEQLEEEFNTNVFGAIRVTREFIPHFRARRQGLFLITTSTVGLVTQPFISLYCASKWALEGWSESMSFELSKFGIGIKTIVPGSMETNFMQRATRDINRHSAYDDLLHQTLTALTSYAQSGSTPEEIAAVVYTAATDNKDQLRYLAGAEAHEQVALREKLGAEDYRHAVDHAIFG